MRKNLEQWAEEAELPLLFMDGHDNAILGIGRQFNKFCVLYSRKKIISNLCNYMTKDEAFEYYEFNIAGAYVGESTPMILED